MSVDNILMMMRPVRDSSTMVQSSFCCIPLHVFIKPKESEDQPPGVAFIL
ncbi:hypothetical protein BVRB_7g163080 [Beta vulgaris subsp. vulgaris]|nr:hypothetical protein BVRB_7g163080 [Beta vulgaris subsp. vulgaris]